MFHDIKSLEILLERQLKKSLPGIYAHRLMTPEISKNLLERPYPETAVPSGVMILIYTRDEEISLVFILRQSYMGVHSNQISFPGGKFDVTDANLTETAIRETEEEIGIRSDEYKILGQLSSIYIPPSNFLVQPTVAISYKQLDFTPQYEEVKSMLVIPLKVLMGDPCRSTSSFTVKNGLQTLAPCFQVDEHKIWGATAMILSELIEIIKEALCESNEHKPMLQ